MTEKRNVPRLRFPGFEGEWTKRKLSQVAIIGRGKSKHRPRDAEFLYGGKYPFVQTGDIKNAALYLHSYTQTYSEEGLKQSKLWDEGTLCVTIAANIAETAILNIKACFPDSIIGITPRYEASDNIFLKYQFDKFKIEIQRLSQGVAQDNLNQEKLGNLEFQFPMITEQRKLANFLFQIDFKISNLQKKKSLLEQYKKGMMQKIFNREIRFKDDDGKEFSSAPFGHAPSGAKWEDKTLGEILTIKYGKDQKQILAENGKYPILGTGGEMGRTNEFLYDKPSVLIGRKGTIDKPMYLESPFWTVDTLFYTEIKEGNFPKWVFFQFQNINWYLYNEASGVPSLSGSTITKIPVTVPEIKEQTKIANFLSAIDDKINLVAQEIEKVERWKKGLLREMFV